MDDGHGAMVEKGFEIFEEINVFARTNRGRCRVFETRPLIGELPGDHIFEPCEVEPLECAREADARFDIDMPEVIRSQGDLIADNIAHDRHVLNERIDAFVRELDAGKRVHDLRGFQHAGRMGHRAGQCL